MSEAKKSEIAVQAIKEGMESNLRRSEIIEKAMEASGASKNYVAGLYNTTATVMGYTAPPEGITYEEAEEIIDDILKDNELPVSASDLAKVVAARDIPKAKARRFVQEYAEKHPEAVQRRISVSKEDRDAVIKDALEAGATRAGVIDILMDKFGCSKSYAGNIYLDALKRNGWESNKPAVGLTGKRGEFVEWLKNHPFPTDEELVEFLDQLAVAENARNWYFAMFNAAKELHDEWSGQITQKAA